MSEIKEGVTVIVFAGMLCWLCICFILIKIETLLKRIADAVEREGKG